MEYLISIIIPPLGPWMKGKIMQGFIALVLWPLLWIPAIIYAWVVIAGANAEGRINKIVKAIKNEKQ